MGSQQTDPTFQVSAHTWDHPVECDLCGKDIPSGEAVVCCSTLDGVDFRCHRMCADQLSTALRAVVGTE